jgi:hypothetical protein
MQGVDKLKSNDKGIIYRTSDNQGPASYRSVCTSVCTVLEVKGYGDFTSEDDFIKYTNKYSIFDEHVLRGWYKNKKDFTVIKLVYNIAFTKKVINKLMQENGINPSYWGFFPIDEDQFTNLLRLGEIDERYIVN